MHILRFLFNLLPDIAGIFLAALSFAVIFTSELLKWLEARPKTRRLLALLLVLLGIGGIISNYRQKSAERDQTDRDKRELTKQIGQLISSAQIQATSGDVKQLREDVRTRLDAMLHGRKLGQSTRPVAGNPPVVEHVRFVERSAPSDQPQYPYGLQVIVQTDVMSQPTVLEFQFDGEVNDCTFFVAGQMALVNVRQFITGDRRACVLGFSLPSWTPETPIVLTALSKGSVHVVGIKRANF